MRFTLPGTVVIALSLDDVTVQREIGVRLDPSEHRTWGFLTDNVESAWCVLNDVNSRCEWQGASWDQPREWRYACRRTLPKLAAQILPQVPEGTKCHKLATEIVRNGMAVD